MQIVIVVMLFTFRGGAFRLMPYKVGKVQDRWRWRAKTGTQSQVDQGGFVINKGAHLYYEEDAHVMPCRTK